MKIIPYEKNSSNNEDVYIDDVSITYHQKGDCTENEDDYQSITLSTRNNGIGRFVNIKTEGWSVDGADGLNELINDFIKRADIV